jgi:glycosyltransferase involved in cell wall biosynthesis
VNAAPLFSIVTPTLNQGRFIEHTIRSLLAQTCTDYEHIVIDGGSTDGTRDILRRNEGRYPMRWVSGADEGMYEAVNKGLAMARGRIHAYLNSDDLYLPWTLDLVAKYLTAHEAIDVVFGDAINIDEETGLEHLRIFPGFDRQRLVEVWPLPQPATFWRAGVSEALSGFDQSLKYVGDWDFFIRTSSTFRVRKLDEVLAIERRHGASKTIGQSDAMVAETAMMLNRYRDPTMSRLGRTFVKARALAARRRTWLRFLREARRTHRAAGGPWGNLLSSGTLSLSIPRLVAGMVPGAPYSWKVGAVGTDKDWLRPE